MYRHIDFILVDFYSHIFLCNGPGGLTVFQDFFYVPWFAAWLGNNRYILPLWFDKQVCYSEIWEEQPTHQEPVHAPDKLQRQQEKWWLCQVSPQQGMQKNCVIKYWQRKGERTAWCMQFVVGPLEVSCILLQ